MRATASASPHRCAKPLSPHLHCTCHRRPFLRRTPSRLFLRHLRLGVMPWCRPRESANVLHPCLSSATCPSRRRLRPPSVRRAGRRAPTSSRPSPRAGTAPLDHNPSICPIPRPHPPSSTLVTRLLITRRICARRRLLRHPRPLPHRGPVAIYVATRARRRARGTFRCAIAQSRRSHRGMGVPSARGLRQHRRQGRA